MGEQPRISNILIDHPDYGGRLTGARSEVYALVDRRLKSGKLDRVPLNEDDLIRLIHQASEHLKTLRRLAKEDT